VGVRVPDGWSDVGVERPLVPKETAMTPATLAFVILVLILTAVTLYVLSIPVLVRE
jgi:hypothetical protein